MLIICDGNFVSETKFTSYWTNGKYLLFLWQSYNSS